jgi:hypothetical protein
MTAVFWQSSGGNKYKAYRNLYNRVLRASKKSYYGKNLPELMDQVNDELEKWSAWFRANKMVVSIKKPKFIIFHSWGKRYDLRGRQLFFYDNEHGMPFDQRKVSEIERVHDDHWDKEGKEYKWECFLTKPCHLTGMWRSWLVNFPEPSTCSKG